MIGSKTSPLRDPARVTGKSLRGARDGGATTEKEVDMKKQWGKKGKLDQLVVGQIGTKYTKQIMSQISIYVECNILHYSEGFSSFS